MSKPALILGADLETDNDGQRAWVVQWAISNGQHEITGTDLASFEAALLSFMTQQKTIIYFHNLKYDLSYFKYSLKRLAMDCDLEIEAAIKKGSPIYVRLIPEKESELYELAFRDSMKKIPGSLAEMAKIFGLEKLQGFDWQPGWSKTVDLTDPANWQYIKMDARIVAIAMRQMHSNGQEKSTMSGDAYAAAKAALGTGPKGQYFHNFKWQTYFPILKYELDQRLRKAYFGGINISRHKGLCEGEITHADVNSMYPAVMYYDPLPHGVPTYTLERPSKGSLYVMAGRFKLKLRQGRIPWFQFKSVKDNLMEGLTSGEPVIETQAWHDLTLTSVDLETLDRWYEVTLDPDCTPEYFVFKEKVGIFREYIDRCLEEKKAVPKGSLGYIVAKHKMNNLYGRFGLNPMTEENELAEIDDDLKWVSHESVNEENDAYLPYAMFITAHARRRLLAYVEAAGCENVIHTDTDSCIHYGGLVAGMDYGKALGQWGLEPKPLRIWEGGYKRYVEQISPEVTGMAKGKESYHLAAAGVPQKLKDDHIPQGMWVEILDDPNIILHDSKLGHADYQIKSQWLRDIYIKEGMNPDCVNTMKLIPVAHPGGYILEERQHKLHDGMDIIRRSI